MNRRVHIHSDIIPALEWAHKLPDYAGAYLDKQNGGKPTFLFTRDLDPYRQGIRERVPADLELSVALGAQSLDDLMRRKDDMSAIRKDLLDEGVVLVSSTVDVVNNRVIVGVLHRDAYAVGRLHALDADVVVMEQTVADADCDMDSCAPAKAGYEIDNGADLACTSGYLARRVDPGHNNIGIITAGHCIAASAVNRWKHAGNPIGTENATHAWQDNSVGDVGFIGLDAEDVPGALNKVLVKPVVGKVVRMTGIMDSYLQIVGTPMCRMGQGSWLHHDHWIDGVPPNPDYTARKCGSINLFDTDSLADPNDPRHFSEEDGVAKFIHHMKAWNWDSWAGDSGGTVFQQDSSDPGNIDPPAVLLGTHVHSSDGNNINGDSWYTSQKWGRDALSVLGIDTWPCVNGDCTNPF